MASWILLGAPWAKSSSDIVKCIGWQIYDLAYPLYIDIGAIVLSANAKAGHRTPYYRGVLSALPSLSDWFVNYFTL